MPKEFRVGIVGAASSYSLHYPEALNKLPGVKAVGMAHLDRDPRYIRDSLNLWWLAKYPKTVEGMADRWGLKLYEQPEEMYDDANLDAVCICTEDYLHLYHAKLAMERGLHVFVPKPFAKSVEEATELFGMAKEKGVVAVGSLPHRHRANSVLASQLIDEGAIGRPISGHFTIDHHITLGGWKSDPSMASGPEYEIGFYVFDQMRMMMKSDVATVTALAANLDHRGIPFIDNAKCLVQCENGALASIDLLLGMHQHFPGGRTLYVVGDEGALAVEPVEGGKEVVAIYTPDGSKRVDVPSWNPFERELGAWMEICRGDGNAAAWQEEDLKTLELISAFKQAHQCGGTVTLRCVQMVEG